MVKLFLDLEMNPIAKGFKVEREACRNEVIQIGVAALNEANQLIGEYEQIVKPQYSETVTPEIYRLTGITSQMISQGVSFEEALFDFAAWCEEISGGKAYEIYAWSDNDLIQLQKEMLHKDLIHFFDMEFMNVWTDYQYIFCELLGIHSVISLDKAVQALDIHFSGNQHNALSDAINTAKLFQMAQNKEEFERIMRPVKEMMEPSKQLSTQMGSVFNLNMFDFESN
jgi:inhibitor of KinA sporulation pathway (predicted exonuclease)